MSLLLDARRKAQQAQSAQGGEDNRSPFDLGREPHPNAENPSTVAARAAAALGEPLSRDSARVAGQNLFNAKSFAVTPAFGGINRKLLLALGGTVLLLTAGAGYVWYVTSASDTPPVVRAQPATPPAQHAPAMTETPVVQPAPAVAEALPKDIPVPAVATPRPAGAKRPLRAAKRAGATPSQQAQSNAPPHIEQHQAEAIDPLLNSAYLAYREGKFEQAQQLYREALKLDERNTDALLGLAVIAQRRGADNLATQYYAQVLELNPRDPVANAAMSVLAADDNRESRLKILLKEQPESSSLNFALGNHYAAQERWGEAQQAYFDAYRLEPRNAALAFNLAVSLDRLGQKKLAAQYYQSALQLDPSHSEGLDRAQISQRIEALTR